MARTVQSRTLDRRITIRRVTTTNTGLGTTETWATVARLFGSRHDISDGERATAGVEEATLRSRFVIRNTSYVASLSPADRLVEGGREFLIVGIKEVDGRGGYLEITADTKLGAAQ
ncbi:head-tail adaptor protein [Paracoccus nototheniae]|uniref:Head-tail adaptor protein n=1 Tax=Paracoccus nototheniae TaxID=2489002 RepID=A0ABW4DZD9_9RHOB|nr:head-tail adaptor protein [Paracoccus nototheniae]